MVHQQNTPRIEWNYIYKGVLLLVQYRQIDPKGEQKMFTIRPSDEGGLWDGTDGEACGFKYISIAGFRIKKVNKRFLQQLNFKPKQ